MTSQVVSFVGLELKYCEQCGGLWLRRQGSGECYCAVCARFVEEIPPPRRDNRRRGGSGPLRRKMRKQHREPGTELVPLQYVVAVMQQEEREGGERAPWPAARVQPSSSQETGYDHL
jgi:Zn-finger nucleic acid-binding protein